MDPQDIATPIPAPAAVPKVESLPRKTWTCITELAAHTVQVICALGFIAIVQWILKHLFSQPLVFFPEQYPIHVTTLLDAIDFLILVEFGVACLVKIGKILLGSGAE